MRGLIRSIWDEPRSPHPPARVWRDWALVGLLALATLLEVALRPGLPHAVPTAIIVLGLIPTLLWRRTRPLLMVAITFGVCAVAPLLLGAELDLHTLAFVLLLAYALLRWGSGREVAAGAAIIVGKILLSLLLGFMTLGDAAGGYLVVFAVFALGAAVRYRARARLRELDQVKLLERERLARDLHDTVAHHVSAMAIRAQAGLATAAVAPDAATDALRLIEAEASRALTEMRTMVRALRRDQPPELAPTPRVADLVQLAGRDGASRDGAGRDGAGPAVEVELVGDLDDLPPAVGAAVYRLAQESVTNARRHARHATRIAVRVAADERSVTLRVSDDGEPGPARSNGSPGFGLIGMVERADLLGGTCQAGPDPGRGWSVTAVLPRAGVPA